jgi:hypothetical protein
MKPSTITAILASILLSAVAVDACKCKTGTKQGQYCGGCIEVLDYAAGHSNHVFECNPSGKCYDYGYRSECAGGVIYESKMCPL